MHNYAVLVINWDNTAAGATMVTELWRERGEGGGTLLRLCYRHYEAIERWNTVQQHFRQLPSDDLFVKEKFIVCLCMTILTEVFPCFFLSCKANARVKPAQTGHGPHSS